MAQQYARDQPAGFRNHIENVAIVGATGSVGEYLTKHLLLTGKHSVTAISRENSNTTMPEGVKVARIDYENPETIVNALKGQQVLIITMKTGQKEANVKLIEAAAKANVGWIMRKFLIYSPSLRQIEQKWLHRHMSVMAYTWAANEYSPDVIARPEMGNVSISPYRC